MIGIALGEFAGGVLVGNTHHAEQIGGQLRVVGANLVRLIIVPLIGRLVLVENRLGLRAMAQHRDHGHQHGQHAHGEGDRPHRRFVRAVFRVFLQFLRFVASMANRSSSHLNFGCRGIR